MCWKLSFRSLYTVLPRSSRVRGIMDSRGQFALFQDAQLQTFGAEDVHYTSLSMGLFYQLRLSSQNIRGSSRASRHDGWVERRDTVEWDSPGEDMILFAHDLSSVICACYLSTYER